MTYGFRGCPCCGASSASPIHRMRFAEIDGAAIVSGYDVVACVACGMVYADDIPSQAAFDLYYAAASKYDGPASECDCERLEAVADTIAEVWPDRLARVLDVGCADGSLLARLRARGFSRVDGIDPSPRCGALAREQYGLDVRQGTIGDLGAGAEPFDLVTLIGVLEHLRDVGACLDALRAVLAPGGALYVEVPDASAFTIEGTAPFQEFSTEHINFFDRHTLNAMAARHGLTMTWHRHLLRHAPGAWRMPTLCAVLSLPDDLRHAVDQYARRSIFADLKVRSIWDKWANGSVPFYVWGAGALTLRLIDVFPPRALVGIIDNNPRYHGKTVGGVAILRPASAAARIPVLVGSVAHGDAIAAEIAALLPNSEVVRL